jgi:hypothetical protein
LNDVINYEVQGGAKNLLKRVVGEIDEAITSHGDTNFLGAKKFAKEWTQANKKFAKHARLYRGKVISSALKGQDPSQIFNKMNTPHGIAQIKKALSVSPEGKALFKKLARYKLEEMIGKNLVNSTSKQVNFGTFSKLLEKGQNRAIVKGLLGPSGLKQLERIQVASGRLAETAQKFLNTSRSGVHTADLALAGKVVHDVANTFSGNPWPLLKSGGALAVGKSMAKYMSDPEFIREVEEIILQSGKGSEVSLQNAGLKLAKIIKAAAIEPPI